MGLTRKQFLTIQFLELSGGAWVLSACGGGGSSYSSPAPPPAVGCNASIALNHGHTLAIPTADLDSTTDKTYTFQGTVDHTHSVTFTPAMLTQLKAGSMVNVTSTTNTSASFGTHSHAVTEQCN